MDILYNTLINISKTVIEVEGFELIGCTVRGSKSSRVVQFFVDHEGGITLDECADLSRKLSHCLDSHDEDLELGSYRLEVSSPGVDRSLRTERDFKRNMGRRVSISFLEADRRVDMEGVVVRTNDTSVCIQTKGETSCVPYTAIQKAKVKLDW